jgi:signal transduction histidine kinase
MLVTILENAVKYSPNNSAIKIQLKKDDTSLQIAVSDNGPGIKLEKQGSIFTKGYRTREAKKNHSGTGLGLYIAKRLADSMGAKITVQSRPGRGSIFTCIFPV